MRQIKFRAKPIDDNTRWEGVVYVIDPDTLCQYWNIKDKQDNEIYNNDIVEVTCEYTEKRIIYHVRYDEYSHSVLPFSKPGLACYDCEYESDNPENIKIIGNMIDNPELLKGKAE